MDKKVRSYSRDCLWGLDVDPDLRKDAEAFNTRWKQIMKK